MIAIVKIIWETYGFHALDYGHCFDFQRIEYDVKDGLVISVV